MSPSTNPVAIRRRPDPSVQQQDWHPVATYTILGVIAGVYLLQHLVLFNFGVDWHRRLFVVDSSWMIYPWTLVTATLSHAPWIHPRGIWHILINGLVLFFFGPTLERLIGRKRFVLLFFAAGALASVVQVYYQLVIFGRDDGGLGASGAIMMVFGALMIVMPNEKILIWGIIPVPFWLAGVGFALLDLLGAFNPLSGVGNVAHLSGLAIGFWVGWNIRVTMKRQGLRLVRG